MRCKMAVSHQWDRVYLDVDTDLNVNISTVGLNSPEGNGSFDTLCHSWSCFFVTTTVSKQLAKNTFLVLHYVEEMVKKRW